MKKTLLSTTIGIGLLFISSLSYGQDVFQQYFDGADTGMYAINIVFDSSSTNFWQIGQPSKTIFNSAATQPNALMTDTLKLYPINNTSSFTFDLYDAQFGGYGIWAVQWMQKLDMEHRKDGGIIEFSLDKGATWSNAFNDPFVYSFYGFDPANQDTLQNGTWAFTGTDTTWRNIWLCLDQSWTAFGDTLRFRFTFSTDSSNSFQEGWMIDNFIAHITILHTVKTIEEEDKNTFSVFPNPSTGILNVASSDFEGEMIDELLFIDGKSRVVRQLNNHPISNPIDVENLPPGAYFLKIKTETVEETLRVIILPD